MLAIHPNARTTPAVRAEIARSPERAGALARRYGVSTETIRKWRERGPADCQDRSARPHKLSWRKLSWRKLSWRASAEGRTIVCALRRSTGFTADGFEHACERHGAQHRKTRPYTPRTNGLVERFNGRVQREALGITLCSHRDLETRLAGFSQASNGRRQRALNGCSPEMVLHTYRVATPDRTNRCAKPPDPDALPKALHLVLSAKKVSHPDKRSLAWAW